MNYCVRTNELYHFGIMGMKWGVRRYQNYDGSYTQEGLRRYRKSLEDYERAKYSGDRRQIREAKQTYKAEKKSLKRDARADRGREITETGRTSGKSLLKAVGFTVLSNGALMAAHALSKNANVDISQPLAWASTGQMIAMQYLYGKAAIEFIGEQRALKEYKKRRK